MLLSGLNHLRLDHLEQSLIPVVNRAFVSLNDTHCKALHDVKKIISEFFLVHPFPNIQKCENICWPN